MIREMSKDSTKIFSVLGSLLDNPGTDLIKSAYEKLEDLIREARVEAIGWAYADCCVTLDKGKDPRQTDMSDVLERSYKDLDFDKGQ